MLNAEPDRAGITVIPGVVAIGLIVRVADVAVPVAREHEAVLGLGVVEDRADGRDAAIKIEPAEIWHIFADEYAAAGKIRMLTEFPLARQNRYGTGAVVEGKVVHRGKGVEGFAHIALEILR